LTPAHHLAAQKKDLADLSEQIRKVKDSQSALAKIQQDYNQSPRLAYLNMRSGPGRYHCQKH
jgi:uncharacterized protein YraI